MTNDNPVCAILTPLARGAVVTVGVRGCGAASAVGRRFRPASGGPLEHFSTGRVVFGRFRMASRAEEELVVGLVGPDKVEVHCHGGVAAASAIADALVEEGCRLADAAEWVAGEQADPLAAAATLALGHARTERTAAVLVDQFRGALRAAIAKIDHQLNAGDVPAASAALDNLLARGEFGPHLTKPWRVVLAGRPNAGKSSLMNAIVGYERAIVYDQPGTTRDVLTASTAIDGWPVELADTAGLRVAEGEIESEGVQRAWGEIARADAAIFVADTTAEWDVQMWAKVAEQAPRRLIVHNKYDLRPPPNDGRAPGVAVSAKTGWGIEPLCGALAELLVPDPPEPGDAVPFTEDQVELLREVAANLERGDSEAARAAIEALSLPRADYDADSGQSL